jgi:hypothetical protein
MGRVRPPATLCLLVMTSFEPSRVRELETTVTRVRPVGRDVELAGLDAFIADPDTGARGYILVGEPGIGKTIVWEATLNGVRGRAALILVARLAEPEQGLSFAGLSDLLSPVAADLLPALPPPQRRALEVALLLREPGPEAVDPRAIGSAARTSFEVLAAAGPIVLAIDDLQWLDGPSAGALAFALRRIHRLPVRLLATIRSGPGERESLVGHPLLDALPARSGIGGLQADLVKLTTKGTQVFAEGAGHDIPAEKPDAVIAAILHVLAAGGGS